MVKPGISKPPCGYQESMNYNSPPAYGGKAYDGEYTKVKIKIPSADDFPDVTPCDPNKPNEDVPNPPTPNEIVPKEPNEIVPKEPNEIVPKEPNEIVPKEPSKDVPHTPTPSNLPKISSPSPKTSNPPTVTERTPIVIIKNTPNVNDETRDKENADINNSENTNGLPNIERKEIKTGDNLSNIIYLIGNRNTLFPPILDNDVFAIHYTTNVDFTEDTADYHEMFDRMKKYYENEPYFEKYEKYKIKKTIFLYNKYAKDKINWVKDQNKKNKLLECKF